MIEVGSDFSGVGAFNQALNKAEIKYTTTFSCDMDKYARETYIDNYGIPDYYPENVYDREVPEKSLDIYMTSPPCQSFSLAGKRKGEDSVNGVLFYNSHEFIVKNKPRFFIFENVKGLLSDAKGRTFQIWLDMLGGKSVNGNPVIFPREDATPYHIYHQVLNAKNYGVPQNRERVFIVGIRDDVDNNFHFPKPFHLVKRLKDVLEKNVDKKFYLSDKNIENLLVYNNRQLENGRGFSAKFRDIESVKTMDALKCGGGGKDDLIKVKSANKIGYEIATENDSINLTFPESETRRGRVGKEVAQTLDTACNQGVLTDVKQINPSKESYGVQPYQQNRIYEGDIVGTLDTACGKPSYVTDYSIRRLTPRECFRLMDFPDSFKMPCSNSQMYKQAGNSIVVNVLAEIIKKLKIYL